MPPLQGLTIVALEHAVAAPFATRQLADLGARVIKIERPGQGDFARDYDRRARGLSSHFVWANRGKQSLTLDLKHPQATPVLERLVARADVVVQNLAPGAAERLGLGWAALSATRPSLILCDISGYGNDGPERDRKAYDLLIQSEAGFLSLTGTPEEPCKAGIAIADIAAGMYAYTNILAALIERGRTGRGQHIDVSMLESLAEWMGHPLYYTMDGAEAPPRSGAAHATIYPYGPFATGDGGSVMLGLQNEREWQAFCRLVLQRPALAEEPRFAGAAARSAARGELRGIIEDVLRTLSSEQVLARLDEAQIANARVNTMQGLWTHAQLRARGRWTEIGSSAGPLPALLPPGRGAEDTRFGPVPKLGEHSEAILAELGFDAAALRAVGAV